MLGQRSIIYSLPPAILLILVCLVQLYFSNFGVLTHWKGGGFGMFSSISHRFIHMHLYDQDRFYCSNIPYSMYKDRKKMENFPTERLLKKYADQMINYPWVKKKYYLNNGSTVERANMVEPYEKSWSQKDSINFETISIEVYDYDFNKENGEVDLKIIKEYRLNK